MLDGIMNVLIFVSKSVNDKFIEVMETKEIAEMYGIADFKMFISIVEGLQEFYSKKIF